MILKKIRVCMFGILVEYDTKTYRLIVNINTKEENGIVYNDDKTEIITDYKTLTRIHEDIQKDEDVKYWLSEHHVDNEYRKLLTDIFNKYNRYIKIENFLTNDI